MNIWATVVALLFLVINLLYFPLLVFLKFLIKKDLVYVRAFVKNANYHYDIIYGFSEKGLEMNITESLKENLNYLYDEFIKYVYDYGQIYNQHIFFWDIKFIKRLLKFKKRKKKLLQKAKIWNQVYAEIAQKREFTNEIKNEIYDSYDHIKYWFKNNQKYFLSTHKRLAKEIENINTAINTKLENGFRKMKQFGFESQNLRELLNNLAINLKQIAFLDVFLTKVAQEYIDKINNVINELEQKHFAISEIKINFQQMNFYHQEALKNLNKKKPDLTYINSCIDNFFHCYTLSLSNAFNQEIRNNFLVTKMPIIKAEIYNFNNFIFHLGGQFDIHDQAQLLRKEEKEKLQQKLLEIKSHFEKKLLHLKILDEHSYSSQKSTPFSKSLITYDKDFLLKNFHLISPFISLIYKLINKLKNIENEAFALVEKRHSAKLRFFNSYNFFESIISGLIRYDYVLNEKETKLKAAILKLNWEPHHQKQWLQESEIKKSLELDNLVNRFFLLVWPQIELINTYKLLESKLSVDIIKESKNAFVILKEAKQLFSEKNYAKACQKIINYYKRREN